MWPTFVVIGHVFRDDVVEVLLAEDDKVIESFVRVRSAKRIFVLAS